jgi:hypothetical protein
MVQGAVRRFSVGAFPRLLKFFIIGLEDSISRPSSLSCGVRQPVAETSANGYICKEITQPQLCERCSS